MALCEWLLYASLITITAGTPQFYVDEPPPWHDYQNRFAPPPPPPAYYPASTSTALQSAAAPPAPAPASTSLAGVLQALYAQTAANPINPWTSLPQQQTLPAALTPAAVESLLARPLLVIDNQVFAMYGLIKCWELQGDLRKCRQFIERCDSLFKHRAGKKKKKGKKGKKKKKKQRNKADAKSDENADNDDDDDDEEADDDEDDEDEDEDDD